MRTFMTLRRSTEEVYANELIPLKVADSDTSMFTVASDALASNKDVYIEESLNSALAPYALKLPPLLDGFQYEIIQDTFGTPHLAISKQKP